MARRQCKNSELYLLACEVCVVGTGFESDVMCLYGVGCLHETGHGECMNFLV